MKRRTRGFTLIELLIAAFVVGTTLVGVFGLFVLALRTAQEGEMRVVAVALANERAEMIRNLPYVDVGTQGGIPPGPIAAAETVIRDQIPFQVSVDILYVDDPYDGLAPADLLNTDYKQVRIEVTWNSPGEPRPILMIMQVVPAGLEGGVVAGTLDFQALNAQGQGVEGAVVQLLNSSLNPAVNESIQTDSQGKVLLVGLPEAADSYELSVSRAGYTSEQTYDVTANFVPDADHVHLSTLPSEVTEKTFFVDVISNLILRTRNEASQPIAAVAYALKGTKVIGADGAEDPVYVFSETGQTDAQGDVSHEALVWDEYDLTIDGETTGYDIKETSELLPLIIDPGDNLDVTVTLVDHTPISLHTTITSPEGLPIDNATVQLTGNGVDETLGTGVVGQVLFVDLPADGDYQLDVSAAGWQSSVVNAAVERTTRVRAELAPE